MSDQRDRQRFAYLERVNAELTQSLRRCHALVDDCRERLAANSNEPPFMLAADPAEGDGEQLA